LQKRQLFSGLTPEEANRVSGLASSREARPGETLVEQWGSERDFNVREGEPGDRFYVVADGELEASVDERPVRAIGRGDCFARSPCCEACRGRRR
jgi:CRP-like cAMP-binding protein